MKQSCGECKFYRVIWRSRMSSYCDAKCTWARHTSIKLPTSIVIDILPSITANTGKTCKCFVAKVKK